MATEALSEAYIVRLGQRRGAIEACFKGLKPIWLGCFWPRYTVRHVPMVDTRLHQ
ncbi:MAG: hypothetical protein AAGD09_01535 [Cyanobacteria bacterium P01_F01_bin.56]